MLLDKQMKSSTHTWKKYDGEISQKPPWLRKSLSRKSVESYATTYLLTRRAFRRYYERERGRDSYVTYSRKLILSWRYRSCCRWAFVGFLGSPFQVLNLTSSLASAWFLSIWLGLSCGLLALSSSSALVSHNVPPILAAPSNSPIVKTSLNNVLLVTFMRSQE